MGVRSVTGRDARAQIGPGDLREIITFEAETRTTDDAGGFTSQWATAATAYAKVEPLFVDERELQGALRNVTQYRFTLYRDEAIGEAMRINWSGRTFNIRGIRRGQVSDLFMDIIGETGAGD